MHFSLEHYGHKLDDFMEFLRAFMSDARYILMNTDVYDVKDLGLFIL